jgi:hypothetical protein
MSHFLTRLTDLLHFQPLGHAGEARKTSPFPHDSASIYASGHPTSQDDLTVLAMELKRKASSPVSTLGQFALLSFDRPNPVEADADADWHMID